MEDEQRVFARAPLPLDAYCRQYGALVETWHQAALLNLSAGGMSFTSEDLFEPGSSFGPGSSLLEIKIQLPTDSAPLILRGMLCRSQAHGTTCMEYGMEFSELTPDQQAKIDQLVQFLRPRECR